MYWLIGAGVVLFSVFFGFVAGGGHLSVLWQPFEFLIIVGASVGGLLTACTQDTLKKIPQALKDLYRGARYKKKDYLELLLLLYAILRFMKTKGSLGLEPHVEKPSESSLFNAFPGVLSNAHATDFLCDYLRLMIMGTDKPHEIEALLDEELDVHHAEMELVPNAFQMMADGMPALGIVAAVLGVIHTMGSISEPPEVLGGLIGAALVGTFVGILLSYGFIGPIGAGIRAVYEEDARYFDCIKASLLAHLNGAAPIVAIEFGRKALLENVRPNFYELESAVSALPAVEASSANVKAGG